MYGNLVIVTKKIMGLQKKYFRTFKKRLFKISGKIFPFFKEKWASSSFILH